MLGEVLEQLKFLLTPKGSSQSKTKLKGSDWIPVTPRDVQQPSKKDFKRGAPDASPLEKPRKPEKWFSAGGVVVASKDDFSRVYVRKPANNFGPWSFAKGKIDKGESPPQAALREVEEELGVTARLVPNGYLGTGEGGYSITHYYLMYAVRDSGRHDKETEKVELLSWSDAMHLFARVGNTRDLKITMRALEEVEKLRKAGKVP